MANFSEIYSNEIMGVEELISRGILNREEAEVYVSILKCKQNNDLKLSPSASSTSTKTSPLLTQSLSSDSALPTACVGSDVKSSIFSEEMILCGPCTIPSTLTSSSSSSQSSSKRNPEFSDTSIVSPLKKKRLSPEVPGTGGATTFPSDSSSSSGSPNEEQNTVKTQGYVCDFEGCTRKNRILKLGAYLIHRRIHTGEKPYVCTHQNCGKTFSRQGDLRTHLISHTERKHACDYLGCGRAFTSHSNLRIHMRIHAGVESFLCEVPGCGKTFTTPGNLNIHSRVHTGIKPYVCQVAGCGKAFSQPSTLQTHSRIHTGIKPYVCDVADCGRAFTNPSNLRTHTRIHTGIKPYVCQVENCGKAFTIKQTLQGHMAKAHKEINQQMIIEQQEQQRVELEKRLQMQQERIAAQIQAKQQEQQLQQQFAQMTPLQQLHFLQQTQQQLQLQQGGDGGEVDDESGPESVV